MVHNVPLTHHSRILRVGLSVSEKQGDVARARQLFEEAHGKGYAHATKNIVSLFGGQHVKQDDLARAQQCLEEVHDQGDVAPDGLLLQDPDRRVSRYMYS